MHSQSSVIPLSARSDRGTSSRMAGRAFSSVEYAKDTPVRLGMGVVEGVADKESNTRLGGPESGNGDMVTV